MNTPAIQSTIPFQPTTLKEASEIIQRRYEGIRPDTKERGVITLRTWTNATHHFQLRIVAEQPESREVPI